MVPLTLRALLARANPRKHGPEVEKAGLTESGEQARRQSETLSVIKSSLVQPGLCNHFCILIILTSCGVPAPAVSIPFFPLAF